MKDFIKRKLKELLDNYFSEKLIREINNSIMLKRHLDVKVEAPKDGSLIRLSAKPVKYKDFTKIYIWEKEDSLKYLLQLNDFCKEIDSRIKYIEENNFWN